LRLQGVRTSLPVVLQGLVLEDEAEEFRHSHLKTLDVERAEVGSPTFVRDALNTSRRIEAASQGFGQSFALSYLALSAASSTCMRHIRSTPLARDQVTAIRTSWNAIGNSAISQATIR
jgi:hypothetical protein